jgi:hypothetical protein
MSETRAPTEHHQEPGLYVIRIKGHLDSRWTHWFEGLTITLADNGDTLLAGPVVDQAALHGVLRRVRDLGMPLLSVELVQPNQEDAALPAATHDK